MNFFASNIRYFRDKNYISRKEMAEILDRPAADIGDWENGKKDPDINSLLLLSELYKTTIDHLLKLDLKKRDEEIKHLGIKLVVMDIDGVLTDGGMYYTESGDEFKKFNSKDGLAIRSLAKKGIATGIISSGYNINLINNRAKLLNVEHVYAGDAPKINIIDQWCRDHHFKMEEIAFIGDDINDLEILKQAGVSACPADAVERVKRVCKVILKRKGGEGCIREFVDEYLFEC